MVIGLAARLKPIDSSACCCCPNLAQLLVNNMIQYEYGTEWRLLAMPGRQEYGRMKDPSGLWILRIMPSAKL
jgi:hypothetical protein